MTLQAQDPPGLPALLSEAIFHLRQGPRRTWQWIIDRVNDSRFDREFGICSARRRVAQLGSGSSDFFPYQPASYRDLKEILDKLNIGLGEVLLDLGAGMGRAVCVAATYPFEAVIGVEISTELCAIAKHNLKATQDKLKCKNVQIVNSDAARYEIPDCVSIIYLFNPFGGAVLTQVLENVAASLNRAPRPVRVVFSGTISSRHFEHEAGRHEWLELGSRTVLGTGVIALSYVNTLWRSHE